MAHSYYSHLRLFVAIMTTANGQGSDHDENSLKKGAYVLQEIEDIDLRLVEYYEKAAGRLVVDPQYVFRCIPTEHLIKCACGLSSGEQTGQGRVRRSVGLAAQALQGRFLGTLATAER